MLTVSDVSLSFGKRTLFKEVEATFLPGNCYGLIGANGAGKSTFLKILSGELEPNTGEVIVPKGERISVLKQDHFAFEEFQVLQTVIMGNDRLYSVMREKDAIYANPEATEEDYMRAGDLEHEFGELGGYNAESEAGDLLTGLGIPVEKHQLPMKELEADEKVRVLLAQALFGNPDILLMDEPTNHLDHKSIKWLEDFLYDFENVVIVVSHDRHFLDRVCTHIADIDYGKITMYTGNYSFWYQSSQLALQQTRDRNAKIEDKRKELEEFIRRFSANASKSRQASSRRKLLEKLTLDDIKPSTRKYPHILFQVEREVGNQVLTVENISLKGEEGEFFRNLSLHAGRNDKIAVVGENALAITRFFQVLAGEIKPDSGEVRWGQTTTQAYFPSDNSAYFGTDANLVTWLRQFGTEDDESIYRGYLGQMLFSGEESQKPARVLSGGEKVRCMLCKMMLAKANVLLFDQPTAHLDLESITSLNDAMSNFKSTIIFTSYDHELVNTVANRIVEFTPNGMIDSFLDYDAYLESPEIAQKREKLYRGIAKTAR